MMLLLWLMCMRHQCMHVILAWFLSVSYATNIGQQLHNHLCSNTPQYLCQPCIPLHNTDTVCTVEHGSPGVHG